MREVLLGFLEFSFLALPLVALALAAGRCLPTCFA
jgi:hypothetical protein